MQSKKARRISLSLLTIVLWAASYVMVRYCSEQFTPFSLTCLRMSASGLTALCLLPLHKPRAPRLRDLPLFLAAALCAYSLYSLLMSLGAQTVPASVSSFVTAFSPVLVPMFALLFLRERMPAMRWLAVGIAGIGVLFLLFTDKSFSSSSLDPGVLWVLLSATLFALYNIIQRLLLRRYTGFEVTAYSTLLGAITLLPLLPKALGELRTAPAASSFFVILLGVVSVLAYILWASALRLADSTAEVTNFMFLTPLLTTLFAFLTMGEIPPFTVYIGGSLMLLGLLLSNFDPKKKAAALEALSAEPQAAAAEGSKEGEPNAE